MDKQKLKKLNRKELIEILLSVVSENDELKKNEEIIKKNKELIEKLTKENENLKKETEICRKIINNKTLIDQKIAITELNVKINGVFEIIDKVADQYIKQKEKLLREKFVIGELLNEPGIQ